MFCPKCKTLMFPSGGEWLCKKCGHTGDTDGKGNKKIITKRTKDKVMMVIEGNLDILPKTKVECPKCGHNEAYWVLRQTRAADEPETRIYRCVKCEKSWREY